MVEWLQDRVTSSSSAQSMELGWVVLASVTVPEGSRKWNYPLTTNQSNSVDQGHNTPQTVWTYPLLQCFYLCTEKYYWCLLYRDQRHTARIWEVYRLYPGVLGSITPESSSNLLITKVSSGSWLWINLSYGSLCSLANAYICSLFHCYNAK